MSSLPKTNSLNHDNNKSELLIRIHCVSFGESHKTLFLGRFLHDLYTNPVSVKLTQLNA